MYKIFNLVYLALHRTKSRGKIHIVNPKEPGQKQFDGDIVISLVVLEKVHVNFIIKFYCH